MDTPLRARPYASPIHADDAARDVGGTIESAVSAVSWAAIFAGAAIAVSVSLILLSLGTGFGLAAVSPWSSANPSVATFSIMTAIWLIVVQWIAAGMGGYMTGRLRTKWVNLHTHEIFFRDTAHGFLAWAVAAILVAALAGSAVGGGVRAASAVAAGGAQGLATGAASAGATDPSGYTTDVLFRSSQPAGTAATGTAAGGNDATGDARAEAARILAAGVANGDVPAADRSYLAAQVAARTGIPQADAEKRVDDAIAQTRAAATKARDAANQARKAASAFAIFTALAMVIGAFIACVAAAYGGRLRDEHA